MNKIMNAIVALRKAYSDKEIKSIALEDFQDMFIDVFHEYRSKEAIFLYEIAKQIIWNAEGFTYDMQMNGESYILQRLYTTSPKIIFDVGANIGEWAQIAREALPQTEIHCFEIVPDTYDILKCNIKNTNNFVLNNFGLLDYTGKVNINTSPENNQISTIVDRIESANKIECNVMNGDLYMENNHIYNIDFLKIDAEGAEHKIIHGFSNSISEKKVQIIQFEYGRNAIDTKFLLKDFYKMLYNMGYAVGKLRSDGVLFKEYSELEENFLGPNYIACLRCRQDLIDRIKVV